MFQHSQPWVPGSQLWLPCHIAPGELETIHAGAPTPREMDLTSPVPPPLFGGLPSSTIRGEGNVEQHRPGSQRRTCPWSQGGSLNPLSLLPSIPRGPNPLAPATSPSFPATALSTSFHEVVLLSHIGSLLALQQVSVFTGTEAKCS